MNCSIILLNSSTIYMILGFSSLIRPLYQPSTTVNRTLSASQSQTVRQTSTQPFLSKDFKGRKGYVLPVGCYRSLSYVLLPAWLRSDSSCVHHTATFITAIAYARHPFQQQHGCHPLSMFVLACRAHSATHLSWCLRLRRQTHTPNVAVFSRYRASKPAPRSLSQPASRDGS